ncbi:MAG: NAD(P)-dependent oxidoreductase [Prevotella sp.]|uniref:NAD-dependent epimerase/dehydratase family protein n=1 Tax=Prevotella sp. TaxID=59823 RepID=UPI002A2737A6|nr:NAD(P)-dependent oxidoreductase [Prevotella sp.]MDD7317727.1 NAD(P)-dependent oxidoreductase [Prevotellaceae bacterium]MDY4020642.1 NAD(P)-dependent oxidoreductase [Prevotella sp.]
MDNTLIEALRGSRWIVTGATGMIGSSLVDFLLEQNRRHSTGISVTCAVRNVAKAEAMFGKAGDEIDYYEYDFASGEPFSPPQEADYLVHLASPTASKDFAEKPVETLSTVFLGTRQVLEHARKVGNRLKGMVYVSSLEVYGTVLDDSKPLTEDCQGHLDLMQARSSYPMSKRSAECLCHAYSAEYGVRVMTARLAQTFGMKLDTTDNRVFAQFARCASADKDIVLFTEGSLRRCYCHTADAVEAMLYIMLRGDSGMAYNVANEATYISVRDMAEMVCREFGRNMRVRIEPREGMGYSPTTFLRLDTSRIMALGWQPKHDLKQMFASII